MIKIESMENCIFCKIVSREVQSDVVVEDKDVIVFKDIHPKAAIHWLIVPKKHIDSVKSVLQEDWPLVAEMVKRAAETAQKSGVSGYKLIFNVGREGGQIIDHLHMHLLAGERIELP